VRMKIKGSKTHIPFFLQCAPRIIQGPSLRFVTADPAWPVVSDAARARNPARLPKQKPIRTYLLKARNPIP
jgi:hypothetical protein